MLLVRYRNQKQHKKAAKRSCLPDAELCQQARLLGLTGEATEAGGQLAHRQASAVQQLQSAAAAATLPAFQAAQQAARQLQVPTPAITTAEATFAARTSCATAQLQAAASSHSFAAYWEARCAAVQLVRTPPASAASCVPCLACWQPLLEMLHCRHCQAAGLLAGVGPAGLPRPETPGSYFCWADNSLAGLQLYFSGLKVPAGPTRYISAALVFTSWESGDLWQQGFASCIFTLHCSPASASSLVPLLCLWQSCLF